MNMRGKPTVSVTEIQVKKLRKASHTETIGAAEQFVDRPASSAH
jgi:hypothetical protein